MEGTGGTSRYQEEKEIQGTREEAFLSCFGGKGMQQPCKTSGAARACSLSYGRVAKDVWQGLIETSH